MGERPHHFYFPLIGLFLASTFPRSLSQQHLTSLLFSVSVFHRPTEGETLVALLILSTEKLWVS